jgi:hypothetical protein
VALGMAGRAVGRKCREGKWSRQDGSSQMRSGLVRAEQGRAGQSRAEQGRQPLHRNYTLAVYGTTAAALSLEVNGGSEMGRMDALSGWLAGWQR